MPVIKVDNRQFSLRPGQNRLGAGDEADVHVDGSVDTGVQAIVELGDNSQVVIRRAAIGSAVRVNGIPLVDPTPLIHGDKVEISGKELLYAEDSKAGDTAFISAAEIAAFLASKRSGPARATAATGGRLVSLVDGKEYSVPVDGIVIGRDASASVVVAENEVSRKHAEVLPVDGGYELRDHSANGVFVNGVRMETPQILSRSDVIRVGSEEFRFYADVQAAAAVAAPTAEPVPVAPPVVQVESKPLLATLEITNIGPTKGQQVEVRVPLAHVGRGAHNDVVLADDSVSESHAKLQRRDDGWYVVDVGSTNGTYVGGQRLSTERRLEGTPDVRFGGVKVIFRANDSGPDVIADTPFIAAVDPAPRVAVPMVTTESARVAATAPANTPAHQGIPAWVWGVVVLAIGAAVAFFLLNR